MNPFKIDPGYFNSVKWGSYSIAIGFIRQIILVSVFIATIDGDYALWIVLYSIVLMIRALNLGQLHFTSNLVNLNYHIKRDINAELILGQGANILYMSFQLLLGIFISIPSVLTLFTNLPVDYLTATNAQYSLILLVFSRVIYQYITLYILRLFEPIGKIQTTIKYQTIGELLDLLVNALAIYLTHSIFYTSISMLTFTLLFSVFMYIYVKKNVPFTIPAFTGLNYKGSLVVIRQSLSLTFSFIVEKIYEVGLNLVIGRAFATSVLPQFDTNRKMSNAFYRVSNVLVTPVLPAIQKEYTLKNDRFILTKMVIYWRFSIAMLLICVTVGMPFFPDIYTRWTGNKINFNVNLICFLFMAIAFQNFSMIFIEFFKKTNLSKQMLVTNIIKVSVTIASILGFGYYRYVSGVGAALLFGEIISLSYVLLIAVALFDNKYAIAVFVKNLIPVIALSLSLLLYMGTLNYLVLLIINAATLGYVLWPVRFEAVKVFKK